MDQSSGKSIRWQLISLVGLCIVLTVLLGVLWERQSEQTDSTETLGATSQDAVDRSLEYYAERQQSALIDISGSITALGNGCSLDGRCSLTVAGKTIMYGGETDASGKTLATQESVRFSAEGPAIGKNVSIKARSYSGGVYSVMQCEECYITEMTP